MLAQSLERNELPQSYFNHHITREAPHGTPVYPFALYTDAVKFQRTDSVLGVWLVSLLTNSRHLVAALRKSEMCACGCRGACTVFGLMVALHWSISCMARGRWPAARHDGAAWRASDHMRAASGGNALGWVGVILFIKCDMMLWGPKVFCDFEKERSSRWQQCKEACPRCRRFRCPSRRR